MIRRILHAVALPALLAAMTWASGCFYHGPREPPVTPDDVELNISDDSRPLVEVERDR